MISRNTYCIDGLFITLLSSSYLVTVKDMDKPTKLKDVPEDLPEWVFRSSHAIWIKEEDAPFSIRVRHGEEIKEQLKKFIAVAEESFPAFG